MVIMMLIKKVKINKSKVEIICDEETFEIFLETYLNNNILVGDEISKEQIKNLQSHDYVNTIRGELIKKISRKRLSKKECINYLSSSNLKEEIVNTIIKDLEEKNFINDEELAEVVISASISNKKGKEVIKNNLLKRLIIGNYDLYLNKYLNMERYKENARYLVGKYMKLGSKKPTKVLKQYIVSKMLTNGYELDEFEEFIVIENINEKAIIKEEISKFLKIREKNAQNIAKITRKLLSKGFNYVIIKSAIEESVINETN